MHLQEKKSRFPRQLLLPREVPYVYAVVGYMDKAKDRIIVPRLILKPLVCYLTRATEDVGLRRNIGKNTETAKALDNSIGGA